jgi:hypothetical protein
MECMGPFGYAICLACLVRTMPLSRLYYTLTTSHLPIFLTPSFTPGLNQLPLTSHPNYNRSMIFFIIAILSFVWRSGSTADSVPPSLSPSAALGPRIALTAVFLLGLVYFVAIVKTLHTYGRPSEGLSGVGAVASEARVRGRGRERQGRRERTGGQDREPARSSRGRERTRRERADHEREATTDRGGLSAVMGLGLTGLDAFASPRSSDEMAREKHQGQAVQAGVDA